MQRFVYLYIANLVLISEQFSYPNTPRSQRARITDILLYICDSTWEKRTNYVKSKMYSRAQTPTIFFWFSFYWPRGISCPSATLTPNLSGWNVVKDPSSVSTQSPFTIYFDPITFYYLFWPSLCAALKSDPLKSNPLKSNPDEIHPQKSNPRVIENLGLIQFVA